MESEFSKVDVRIPGSLDHKKVLIKVENDEPKKKTESKFKSYTILSNIHMLQIDDDKNIFMKDFLEVLFKHGLSTNIPVNIILGKPSSIYPDWSPHNYGGQTSWSFQWVVDNETISCSLTGINYKNYIRIHDLRLDIQERVMDELTAELRKYWKPSKTTLNIYSALQGNWTIHGIRHHRQLDTIYIDPSIKDLLVHQLDRFVSSEKIYDQYGVVWKRVHLLHGPPGTGKTSMIHALASHYNKHLCKLSASNLKIDSIEYLIRTIPSNSWLVIEDITEMFVQREAKTNLDFSSLLNIMDGLITPRGLVVFMTTNHIGSIDKALIRPGRVDSIIEFTPPTYERKKEALQRLGPQYEHEHELFLKQQPHTITIAEIQQHIFECIIDERESML